MLCVLGFYLVADIKLLVNLMQIEMAEASAPVAALSDELLEWPKKDKRRFLHAVYRVGNLDRTIAYVTSLI